MTQELTTKIYIETALKEFSVTDIAIAELSDKYLALTIVDIDDKAGYQAVSAARKDVKARRIEVDKKRKALTADALAIQKGINDEAKRITSLLEPIENALSEKESWYESEKERIKKEKEEAEKARLASRIEALRENGYEYSFMLEKVSSKTDKTGFSLIELKTMSDEIFLLALANAQDNFIKEEEERKRLHAEAERILAEAEAQKLAAFERERLEFQEKERLRNIELRKEMEEREIARQKQREERQAIEEEKARLAEAKAEYEREQALLTKQRIKNEKINEVAQAIENDERILHSNHSMPNLSLSENIEPLPFPEVVGRITFDLGKEDCSVVTLNCPHCNGLIRMERGNPNANV